MDAVHASRWLGSAAARVCAAGTLAVLLVASAEGQHAGVRIQVIDRGQADGILIRTPNERWVVIDAGADRQQAEAMASEWDVDRVSLAIVSHRHGDHLRGIDEILERFDVDRLLINMVDCEDRVSDDRVRRAAKRRNVATQSLGAHEIAVDGVRFIIPPPDPQVDECPDEENNNSIIVRLELGEFSMLFAGDAENRVAGVAMRHHARGDGRVREVTFTARTDTEPCACTATATAATGFVTSGDPSDLVGGSLRGGRLPARRTLAGLQETGCLFVFA